jgi:hypothetical protein
MQSAGTIYQMREPEGDWHIFKHASVKPTDEFNKLTPVNLVSVMLDKARVALKHN